MVVEKLGIFCQPGKMTSKFRPGEGDWICSDAKCGNVNFSRRAQCNKCGVDKPVGSDYKKGGAEIGKAMAEKSKGLFSADDWQCKTCGNVNWARRSTCNMCNTPKYGKFEPRTGFGGGYMERDEVVEYKQAHDDSGDEFDEFGRKKKKFRGKLPPSGLAEGPAVPVVEQPKTVTAAQEEEEEEDEDEEDDDEDLSKYQLESDDDDDAGGVGASEDKVKPSASKSRSRSRSRSRSSSSSSESSSSSSSRSRSRSRSGSRSARRSKRSYSRSRSRSGSRERSKRSRHSSSSGSSHGSGRSRSPHRSSHRQGSHRSRSSS